jgi:hypothetical protein
MVPDFDWLSSLLPSMVSRFVDKNVEEKEEVKVPTLELLAQLIASSPRDTIYKRSGDISKILQKFLLDPFDEVRKVREREREATKRHVSRLRYPLKNTGKLPLHYFSCGHHS